MQPFLRYALRGLTKRPCRSLFIIFMISVGIMLMAGTTLAIKNIPVMLETPVEQACMADFSLTMKMAPQDTVEDICKNHISIKEFDVRLVFRTIAYAEKSWPKSTDILLIGVETPVKLNKVVIVAGRFFEEGKNEIVAEHDYGVNLLNREVLVETPYGNVTFKIAGTCRAVWMPRWAVSSTAYALVPLKVLQDTLKIKGYVNNVLVKVREGSDPNGVMESLAVDLTIYGVSSRSLEGKVIPFVETQAYYNFLVNLLSMIGLSLLIVGLALLYGSLTLMVTQEYRDIGTLKALGASSSKIVLTYSLRGLLLGIIGGSIGSLMGVIAANLILSGLASTNLTVQGIVYTTQSIFEIAQNNVDVLSFYALVGVFLSTLLVLPPAFSASRVPVARAVRAFPGMPLAGGGERSKLGFGPLFIRYAFRSLRRRKLREAVVISAIVIIVAMNSALITASESQQKVIDEVDKSLTFDFFVCLSERVNSRLLQYELKVLKDKIAFQDFAYYTYAKVSGYTLLVIGIPKNISCFNYKMIDGRWLQEEREEVILTENLAKKLNVWVGDVISLSNERISLDVKVVGVRKDPVLNILIVPISIVQNLDGYQGKVNAVVLKAKDGVNIGQLVREIKNVVPKYLWHIKKSGAVKILSDILTNTFKSTAAAMITFNWITIVILIFSVLGQNINEERMVFTMLRALGMRKRICLSIIVFKLFVIGLFAALLSMFITPLLLQTFSRFLIKSPTFSIPSTPSLTVHATSIFFIMAATLPCGLILGTYIVQMKVSEALRYE